MWNENLGHIESDLRQHEEAQARGELKFQREYQDNFEEILSIAKELTLNTKELVKRQYMEMEDDVLIFISVMYEHNKLKFTHLPTSYRLELFEAICNDLDRDFDDYETDLMGAT